MEKTGEKLFVMLFLFHFGLDNVSLEPPYSTNAYIAQRQLIDMSNDMTDHT